MHKSHKVARENRSKSPKTVLALATYESRWGRNIIHEEKEKERQREIESGREKEKRRAYMHSALVLASCSRLKSSTHLPVHALITRNNLSRVN